MSPDSGDNRRKTRNHHYLDVAATAYKHGGRHHGISLRSYR